MKKYLTKCCQGEMIIREMMSEENYPYGEVKKSAYCSNCGRTNPDMEEVE